MHSNEIVTGVICATIVLLTLYLNRKRFSSPEVRGVCIEDAPEPVDEPAVAPKKEPTEKSREKTERELKLAYARAPATRWQRRKSWTPTITGFILSVLIGYGLYWYTNRPPRCGTAEFVYVPKDGWSEWMQNSAGPVIWPTDKVTWYDLDGRTGYTYPGDTRTRPASKMVKFKSDTGNAVCIGITKNPLLEGGQQ